MSPPSARAAITALRAARWPASWFAREAAVVARDLIGCALVHRQRAGIIVETEAYGGPEDLASHARFGPTRRTSVMFGPGGITYVYLCYGIHQLFNVVTGADGHGQAVLIRAIAPHVGLPEDPAIGRGPGKVSTALALDRSHDRKDLARGALFIAPAQVPPVVAVGPRIGVAFAGTWATAPLRFWWDGHPSVSGRRDQSGPRGPVVAGRSVSTRRRR